MKGILRSASTAWACSLLLISSQATAKLVELPSPIVRQQTPVWCWAATASMVLEYLLYPTVNPARNYQCGVVAVAFPECDADCTQCITPIGPMTNLVAVLNKYIAYVAETKGVVRGSTKARFLANPTFAQVKQSIDKGYPVIAGISPDGPTPANPSHAQHVVLITGYGEEPSFPGYFRQSVVVNDPYIYTDQENPYLREGSGVAPVSGKGAVDWNVFKSQLNFTGAIVMYSGS